MAGWIEFQDCPKCGKECYTEDDMYTHTLNCNKCGYTHTITRNRHEIDNKIDNRMEDIVKSRLDLCRQQYSDIDNDMFLTNKEKGILKAELIRDINHYSYQLLYLSNPNVEDECF